LARRHGFSEDQITHLADFEKREDFSPQEKVALRFAECMTRDAHTVDDELWIELRKYFDEGEIVELAAAIGSVQLLQPLQRVIAYGAHQMMKPTTVGLST